MSGKLKTVFVTYIIALISVLGIFAWLSHNSIEDYHLAAKYSSGRAFEETVYAVNAMSTALEKSLYATDGGMCSKICSQVYANALAAESAMAALPFSTLELEQISAFLNVAGDYAYTLSSLAAEKGFSPEQVETLTKMSATAKELTAALYDMRSSVNSGELLIDSSEKRLRNVGMEDGRKLSEEFLAREAGFPQAEAISYDGKYSAAEEAAPGNLSEDEMLHLAAEYVNDSPENLTLEHEYSGTSGRRCYRSGDTLIFVSPSGVESLNQNRLVSQSFLSQEEAEQIASAFLKDRGFENLKLIEISANGAVAGMKFAAVENDAVCLDNTVTVSVALDDGSIYSFNAENYSAEESGASWGIDESQAVEKLPESLKLTESRKVILKNPAGKSIACYELRCQGQEREVKIYVDAQSGKQYEIVI